MYLNISTWLFSPGHLPCSSTEPQDKSKDPVGNVDTSKIKQMEERRKASESLACAKSSEALQH